MYDKDTVGSELYSSLEADRSQYETRAKKFAKISIPYAISDSGYSASASMSHEISQSFNGMLVNNLKAKIGMALLPPSTSSFRLQPDASEVLKVLGNNETAIAKLSEELSINTDAINSEIERQQIRSDMFDMILQLLVVGSVIVEKIKGEGIQLFPLKSFVVDNDSRGRPLAMVVKETVKMLPEGITVKDDKEEYDIYTLSYLDADTRKWIVRQDINGEPIGEEKSYDYDNLPFRYFGWTWALGDKYHRPFIEDYYDDMNQVNSLAKLNTSGSIIAAKVLLLVDQRGNRTRKADVANSANGDIIDGRADDITAFQLSKNYDFEVSNDREQSIMKTLRQSFLDNTSVTRDAERVTAQEIQYLAQQLESSTLAGIYSKMSLQWSKWLPDMIMDELGIKFESIKVDVLTGLDAIGRSAQAQKLDGFIQRIVQLEMKQWLNDSEIINRYASYEGINQTRLVKTPEEVQQAQQQAQEQAQEQQMMEAGAQSAGQAGGQAMVEGMV